MVAVRPLRALNKSRLHSNHGTVSPTCPGGESRAASNENGPFSTEETSNTDTDDDDNGASFLTLQPATTRMASTLLRRQLARAQRLPSSTFTSSKPLSLFIDTARRHLSRSAALQAEAATAATTRGGKSVFDTHTVEDLHGMHASEILAETGSREEAQLRHFTGE